MAKIKQFEAFTKNFVAYKKNWVYGTDFAIVLIMFIFKIMRKQ